MSAAVIVLALAVAVAGAQLAGGSRAELAGTQGSAARQRPRKGTPPRRKPVIRNSPAPSVTGSSDGEKLFVAYNCIDCHGGGGSGLMAPSLADNRWRYGGSAPEILSSIADGRPEGMPRWGPLIPREHLLKLVAYVQTLGRGKDVATMNFTGAKVERTGHD